MPHEPISPSPLSAFDLNTFQGGFIDATLGWIYQPLYVPCQEKLNALYVQAQRVYDFYQRGKLTRAEKEFWKLYELYATQPYCSYLTNVPLTGALILVAVNVFVVFLLLGWAVGAKILFLNVLPVAYALTIGVEQLLQLGVLFQGMYSIAQDYSTVSAGIYGEVTGMLLRDTLLRLAYRLMRPIT